MRPIVIFRIAFLLLAVVIIGFNLHISQVSSISLQPAIRSSSKASFARASTTATAESPLSTTLPQSVAASVPTATVVSVASTSIAAKLDHTAAPVATAFTLAATAAPTAATAAPTAASTSTLTLCQVKPRPYHVLLTASSGSYQAWQSRVFHYHYKRLKASDPCGDIGEFTRLLTLPVGTPLDNLAATMRTVTSTELLKGTEDLGFVVLNRPHSLRTVLKSGALSHITEEHILIVETDHVFIKPLTNLAAAAEARGDTGAFHAVGYPL